MMLCYSLQTSLLYLLYACSPKVFFSLENTHASLFARREFRSWRHQRSSLFKKVRLGSHGSSQHLHFHPKEATWRMVSCLHSSLDTRQDLQLTFPPLLKFVRKGGNGHRILFKDGQRWIWDLKTWDRASGRWVTWATSILSKSNPPRKKIAKETVATKIKQRIIFRRQTTFLHDQRREREFLKIGLTFFRDMTCVPPRENEHHRWRTSRPLRAHVSPGMQDKLTTKCFLFCLRTCVENKIQLANVFSQWGGIRRQLKW